MSSKNGAAHRSSRKRSAALPNEKPSSPDEKPLAPDAKPISADDETLPDEEPLYHDADDWPSFDDEPFKAPSDLEVRKQRAVVALHEQFDRLSALWTEKENELVAMHVPMPVSYVYKKDVDEQGSPDLHYHIGLARWRGQWRLLHAVETAPSGEADIKPIVEASLDYRLEAAEHFDKLREKVIEAAEESVAKVQNAIVALSR